MKKPLPRAYPLGKRTSRPYKPSYKPSSTTAKPVFPAKVMHPELMVPVARWIRDAWAAWRTDPRRDPMCDGCQAFGICVEHSTPPENRLSSGLRKPKLPLKSKMH